MRLRFSVISTILSLSTLAYGDDLRISIYPRMIVANPKGAAVRVTVRVPRSNENETLFVGWQYAYPGESGHFVRDLDEGSPGQFIRIHDHIPSGITTFTAELRKKDGTIKRVEETLEVR